MDTCLTQAAEVRKDMQRLEERLAQFDSLHVQLEALLRRWEAEQPHQPEDPQ